MCSEVSASKDSSVPLLYLGLRTRFEVMRCDVGHGRRGLTTASPSHFVKLCTGMDTAAFQIHCWTRCFRAQTPVSTCYPNPKIKRRDDRLAVVTLPNCALVDLQKRIVGLDHSLGIVRVREQLAVRCRRENATQLRSVLLPESAYEACPASD